MYSEILFHFAHAIQCSGFAVSLLRKLCPEDWMLPMIVEQRTRFGAATIGARFVVAAPIRWAASGCGEGERVTIGYLYMLLSLLCFGLIGIFAKFADARECKPSAVYTLAYGWSVLFGAMFVILFRGADFHIPAIVYAIALPFGVASAIGGIVFMTGIRYGKISTSWLVINLSAAVPAVASVLVYHERISPRKIAMVALAIVSVILLWKDKQADEARQRALAPSEEAA